MASLTGRLANFTSKHVPWLNRSATHRQIAQFRKSGGEKGNRLFGRPTFILDVVGRSSGESRPVMLMLVRDGDDLVVCGSNGGNPQTPNWYRNLTAAGGGHVEVGADRWAVTATELSPGAERDRLWALLTENYPDFASYQELTDRSLPVAVLRRV